MSICHYNVFFIFLDSYKKAKEKLLLAENMSDLTADEGTENEIKKSEKEKKSRHLRVKKINSSSKFDSDENQKLTKLSRFPKIPDKLYSTNDKRIYESQKVRHHHLV